MVPMDRPGPALQMISNFIFKRPYSTIVPYNVTLQPLIEPYQPQPAPTGDSSC
ncbi:unnamed protein product [Anisakis simplex]|uniref:ORF29 n=1 Tax=Anisakis simplex TaxID=6269 RepID=A0A0M3JNH0_ANISI|nr:unnamed protein product [Anisakis simplex]